MLHEMTLTLVLRVVSGPGARHRHDRHVYLVATERRPTVGVYGGPRPDNPPGRPGTAAFRVAAKREAGRGAHRASIVFIEFFDAQNLKDRRGAAACRAVREEKLRNTMHIVYVTSGPWPDGPCAMAVS